MSSKKTSKSTGGKPSNHATIAALLSNSGFGWSSSGIEDIVSNSSSISFDEEWKKFVEVVQDITRTPSTANASSAGIPTNSTTHTFSEGAASFATPTGTSTDTAAELASAISAWKCFQDIIDPVPVGNPASVSCPASSGDPALAVKPASIDLVSVIGSNPVGDVASMNDSVSVSEPASSVGSSKKRQNFEQEFDIALFEALRKSLNGFVDETQEANWIVLKNSIIGFGRKVWRGNLGFDKDYALSGDSECDHGCFVLGTDTVERLERLKLEKEEAEKERLEKERLEKESTHIDIYRAEKKARSACRAEKKARSACKAEKKVKSVFRAEKKVKSAVWYNDMTATVELKLEKTSCENFSVKNNIIDDPILGSSHGPMGQAIMYTLDSWHCLARRGVSVTSVPVVILAGRRGTLENESKKTMICCLEAHLKIPQYFGMKFKYSIDRIVSFNGTTGLTTNEQQSDKESRDKRAIAIYIKTMRFGLEKAQAVMSNCRGVVDPKPPVSLCCCNLLEVKNTAHIIASPIPREKHQWKPGIKISQGEFFQITKPTQDTFSGIADLSWFAATSTGYIYFPDYCLVKVCCVAVHNIYVSPVECYLALKHLLDKGSAELKVKISDVLMGFFYWSRCKSLLTILKDLQKGDKVFTMLEHKELCTTDKRSKLWDGFCDLVNSVLLPMADVKVVHLDIRSSSEFTFNILVHENETKIELCLIDFDSVVLTIAAEDIDQNGHDDAIWFNQLALPETNSMEVSAYHYLFWQILWIAYSWLTPSTQQAEITARHFVSSLFKDKIFVGFHGLLGKHSATFKSMNNEKISRVDIQNALIYLKEIF